MKIGTALSTALTAVSRNKTRAALTMLGIIIGIAAVIAMMEIGRGSATAIQKTIASMGANNLTVRPGTAASGGISFGAGSVLTLTPEDADAIARECPAVASVAPTVRARTQVIYGNKNWVPQYIYGTTPSYLKVRGWEIESGECFTDRDVRGLSKVCLIGKTIQRELFGAEDPVGRELRIANTVFKVIGVLAQKGANMMGMDQDDLILAPWRTIKGRVTNSSLGNVNQSAAATSTTGTTTSSPDGLYPGTGALYPVPSATQQADTPLPVRFTNVDEISVSGASSDLQPAIEQITRVLRERHQLHKGEPDDFNIRDMTEMTKAVASTAEMMTNLLLSVALISLVVGGVGIMNIMLVSVTERTREIGLRMAVGARGGDILQQFLTEAVVLCLTGGVLGILLGRGSSYTISKLLGWTTETSAGAVAAAAIVATTVGVVFGFYPAWKASRLNPIEALRYE